MGSICYEPLLRFMSNANRLKSPSRQKVTQATRNHYCDNAADDYRVSKILEVVCEGLLVVSLHQGLIAVLCVFMCVSDQVQ